MQRAVSEHELAAEGPATAQATCGNNDQACFPGFALKYSFPVFKGNFISHRKPIGLFS